MQPMVVTARALIKGLGSSQSLTKVLTAMMAIITYHISQLKTSTFLKIFQTMSPALIKAVTIAVKGCGLYAYLKGMQLPLLLNLYYSQ